MILDGKKQKEEILNELKTKVINKDLSLAVIQIGNDEASNVYIKQKENMCNSLNINFKHYHFNEDVSEEEVIELINKLNSDDTTGILLQLPIPKRFNKELLENLIDYKKDVDGLNRENQIRLINKDNGIIPCTSKGIMELLNRYNINVEGKHVVIVGRSNLVGRPLASLMLNSNATVSVCHSYTNNLKDITIQADILVVAVGKKHLISKDMVRKNAIVIDAGINRVDGKLYGDVEDVSDIASYYTPVPGGVGPMTIACLAQNIYEAYLLKEE